MQSKVADVDALSNIQVCTCADLIRTWLFCICILLFASKTKCSMPNTLPLCLHAICLQALLQAEAAGLQQQLTWLQSHASLQDNINQDLMAEVVHLRAALAALSAAPPQQP